MTTRDDAGAGLDACAELNDSDLGWMDALDGVGLEPAASNGDELRPPPAKKKKHAARRPARPLAPPGVSLAPEERARLEKERNREHARNTRARKKEALEKLRREVAGLEEAAVERDESERRDFAKQVCPPCPSGRACTAAPHMSHAALHLTYLPTPRAALLGLAPLPAHAPVPPFPRAPAPQSNLVLPMQPGP